MFSRIILITMAGSMVLFSLNFDVSVFSRAESAEQSAFSFKLLDFFKRTNRKPIIPKTKIITTPIPRPVITPHQNSPKSLFFPKPVPSHQQSPLFQPTIQKPAASPTPSAMTPTSSHSESTSGDDLFAKFQSVEREIMVLYRDKNIISPDHYARLSKALDRQAMAGADPAKIKMLREMLATVDPAQITSTAPSSQPSAAPSSVNTTRDPVIKNLGINFDTAFAFLPSEDKVFLEYGAEVNSSSGGTKILPTFEYRTLPEAEVFAVMDGVVSNISYQSQTQDYEIHIQPSTNSQWVVGHDHVRDLKVSKGSSVKAGEVLGKVGSFGNNLGRTEIMLWTSSGSRPLTHCPFKYFDPALVDQYQQKVTQHMKDWEAFKGNSNLYNEEKHILPGCIYESLLD